MSFSDILKKHSKNQVLLALQKTADDHQLAMAAWRLPLQDKLYMICGQAQRFSENEDFKPENVGPGFCFFPFRTSEDTPGILIQPTILLSFEGANINILSEEGIKVFKTFMEILTSGQVTENNKGKNNLTESSESRFKEIVVQAREQIRKEGDFKKVVLARNQFVDPPSDFSPTDLFLKTAQSYPHAFAFLFSYSPFGTWMGATPEILVQVTKENTFKTVALAGTQSSEGKDTSDAVWTQKEIEEQALVSRYIINCFKQIRLREFEEEGPLTVRAAGLLHLKTYFSVDLNQIEYKGLGNDMLKLLHPTSAVCGMPRNEAMQFILDKEDTDREYFSGFSGPVNIDNEINIFVNLRCARLDQEKIVLFSGAGITRDSNPDKEWLETSLKIKTIGDLINPTS
ncbi:chorismate-binding protein [Cytophagaceae bacterium ABcell3]|nr:chorismate-binding protein [Cytophagaceae bacterium ABcell3]